MLPFGEICFGKTIKMMTTDDFIDVLSEEQLAFIEDEFSLTEMELQEFTVESLGEIYSQICDIELDEVMRADGADTGLSTRGVLAQEIVHLWCNLFWEYDDLSVDYDVLLNQGGDQSLLFDFGGSEKLT